MMNSELKGYQKRFIELAIEFNVLKFGEFKLKSGRMSPYFFNAGNFNRGRALHELGCCYADAIVESGLEPDLLFGPAYKGIPLVTVTAAALAERHGRDLPYCFNRKEAKDHGEGGNTVGAELCGNSLLVDDVITAGTAIREIIALFEPSPARVAGVLVGLDRQERAGEGTKSAIGQIEADFDFPVISIIGLEHIRNYLMEEGNLNEDNNELVRSLDEYRDRYGV